jgi:hypothetical protein
MLSWKRAIERAQSCILGTLPDDIECGGCGLVDVLAELQLSRVGDLSPMERFSRHSQQSEE